MNNHHPSDDIPRDSLDDLLQQWASATGTDMASGSTEVQALQDRIAAALQASTAAPPVTATRFRRGTWAAMAALAAALLVIATLVATRRHQPQPQPDVAAGNNHAAPDEAFLSALQLASRRQFLTEAKRLFADDFAWVAETDNNIQLGIESQHANASPDQALLVRVVVMQRLPDQQTWSSVWTADVVAREQQVVVFKPTARDRTQWVVWTYLLPDGLIQIDSQLILDHPTTLTLACSELQHPGVPADVYTTQLAGTEYRIFQTAIPLNPEATPVAAEAS